MSSFVSLNLFPFCPKNVDPSSENERYNDYYSSLGVGGVGSIYPVGMSLEDAMALYWLLNEIQWNFTSTVVVVGESSSTTYNSSGGNFYLEKTPINPTFANLLRYRLCEPPSFTHELTGSATLKNNSISNFSPFSCFFEPSRFYVDDDEFSRILEWNGLFYPSMFLVFWNYSVLYSSQKFISNNYDSTNAGGIDLIINGNSYSIPMFKIFNYTPQGTILVNFSDIVCSLHENTGP